MFGFFLCQAHSCLLEISGVSRAQKQAVAARNVSRYPSKPKISALCTKKCTFHYHNKKILCQWVENNNIIWKYSSCDFDSEFSLRSFDNMEPTIRFETGYFRRPCSHHCILLRVRNHDHRNQQVFHWFIYFMIIICISLLNLELQKIKFSCSACSRDIKSTGFRIFSLKKCVLKNFASDFLKI